MLAKIISLLKQSAVYSLTTVTMQVIGVILVPVYTRVFTPDQYGVIDLSTTLTVIVMIFLIAGLDVGVGRYYTESDSREDKRKTASTGIIYLAIVSLVVILFLLPFSRQLSQLVLGSPDYSTLLFLALISLPFTVLNSQLQALLRWRLEPVRVVVLSIGTLLLQITLTICLVVVVKTGVNGVFIATLAAQGTFSLVGFYLTRSSYALVFSRQRLGEMLRFGLPYIVVGLCVYVLTSADRYLLRHYLGLDIVGLYGIGYRISSAMNLLVAGFQAAWAPFVFTTYKDENANHVFSKVFDYTSIVFCLAVLFLSLFSREILHVIAAPEYAPAYKVVPLLAGSMAVSCLAGAFSMGFALSKRTIHLAWTGILAAVANVILNVVLIPHFGMVGSATATLVSFGIMGIALMVVSQRLYPVPYRFLPNLVMCAGVASVIALSYVFLLPHVTWLNLGLKTLIMVGFLLVPFVLRLLGGEIAIGRSIVTKVLNRRK